MYLDALNAESASLQIARLSPVKDDDWEMIQRGVAIVWRAVRHTFGVIFIWILDVLPSLTWTFDRISDFCAFVEANPHPFHILAWSLFFGPIILLIPCLLILELTILILFYSGFAAHGLLPGSMEGRFHVLKESFEETRESLFSTVESWTTIFNNWTSKHPALLVLRLVAAGVGLIILAGIWTSWTFTAIDPSPSVDTLI
ncbi:hypothetical protein CPB83DRAFT_846758 [Crepidotus variabilis]|uniref:Uncharacterized protein n=1 Tax=Crepidotus variabilis TaxID=179855 RepID=A0A9P6JUZ7_9AGAR|nr:hypothetical protein CPB83DRAFT_846758 [Crepidotus variabilis]